MKWFLRIGFTVLSSLLVAGLAGAAPKHKYKTGARRTPAHKLISAPRFKAPEKAPPPQIAYVPKQLSMWGNDVNGDCVTAEEAFAKATYQPEIFLPDATVVAWATANGYLNGADLSSVLQSMQSGGFVVGQQTYNDGTPSTVDYTTEAVLQAAIASGGPVKIGIDSTALPANAGPPNGWYAFGGSPGQYPNTDHCVSVAGYGPTTWLAQQLGITVPPGAPANGYLIFTWSSIGIVDFAWIQSTCVEAWVRNPTTVGVPPLTPGPTPPGPTPTPTPSGVTITLAGTGTSADGIYVPQGTSTGLTAQQIAAMTVQQLADYLNQSKGKPKPPAPPTPPAKPTMPPAKPTSSVEQVLDRLADRIEQKLGERIDRRLDTIEGRIKALEKDRSISAPTQPTPSYRFKGGKMQINSDGTWRPARWEKGEWVPVSLSTGKEVIQSDRVLRPNATISGRTPDVVPVAQGAAGKQESYADAYRRALAQNKPLLVWVGGEFCPT